MPSINSILSYYTSYKNASLFRPGPDFWSEILPFPKNPIFYGVGLIFFYRDIDFILISKMDFYGFLLGPDPDRVLCN